MPKAVVVLTVGSVLVVAMSVALWILAGAGSRWDDGPGRELAARINGAGSPLIDEVVFRPHTVIDPPEVHVIVRAGVTEAQAEQLWCQVVAPAGGSPFEGNVGASIYDQSGAWLASGASCP